MTRVSQLIRHSYQLKSAQKALQNENAGSIRNYSKVANQLLGKVEGTSNVCLHGKRLGGSNLFTKLECFDSFKTLTSGMPKNVPSRTTSTIKSSVTRMAPLIQCRCYSSVQRRSMFIQTQSTPNPLSLMFYPGKPVMEVGSADFPNARAAMTSPLAKALFGIDGVTRVFYGSDFVTVTKSEEASWDYLKPEVFAAIMDFYTSGNPLFLDSKTAASMDTAIQEDDSEIVAMIKELLETRIRPAVQDDGGDIVYRRFDEETGIVKLQMQGACSGCPSSSVTLKSGIENMLMHYVPEVKGVEQEFDPEEEATLTSQLE